MVDFVAADGSTKITLPWPVVSGASPPRRKRHALALAARLRVRAASGEVLLDQPSDLARLVAAMT